MREPRERRRLVRQRGLRACRNRLPRLAERAMLTSMRPAPNARFAALFALTAATPSALWAATTQSNLTSPNSLAHALHFLYGAVSLMGLILIVIGALAYATYRRNQKEELNPNETDDSVR